MPGSLDGAMRSTARRAAWALTIVQVARAAPTPTTCLTVLQPMDGVSIKPLITPGNPFFSAEGLPCFTMPPTSLTDELEYFGCKQAWHRQGHVVSELDERCTGIVDTVLLADDADGGVVLGLYSAIFQVTGRDAQS